MFCKVIIHFVEEAAFPIDVELALTDVVANPVKAHSNSFRAFLFESIVGDASGGAVVGYNSSKRLGMAKFFHAGAKRARVFAIVEEGGKLSFGDTGDDFAEDLAENIDGAVGWRSRRVSWRQFRCVGREAAEKMITGGTGTSFGGGEIGGVALYMVECHVAYNELDGGVRVSGPAVEELS
jgi:hypothetical protein